MTDSYTVGDRVRIIKRDDPYEGTIATVIGYKMPIVKLDVPLEATSPAVQERAYYFYDVESA